MNLKSLSFVIGAAAFVLIHCAPNRIAGGGAGEETTNGRAYGVVVDSCGQPVMGATVVLCGATYDPVRDSTIMRIDTTDSAGRYIFIGIDSGVYNVRSTHVESKLSAMVTNVAVHHDTVELTSMKLLPPGEIRIGIPSGADVAAGYVYIQGTDIFVYLNGNTEWIVLDSVPAGCIPSIAYAVPNNDATSILRYDITVAPAETANVFNPDWLYARRVVFNTAPAGADVPGAVLRFPVLVRLATSNFNFAQARNDGADIRFTKADNTFLPYEIERWDAVNSVAEVWVNVDTIIGNDSDQFIMIYWGNANAADSVDGERVFDTANGFIGVWHMNETPSVTTASIKDRSANGFHATPFGSMTAENSVEGAVGKALDFNGRDDYLNAGNVSVPGIYSIGLWVQLDTLGDYQRFIFKDSSYTLWYDKDSVSVRMEHMPVGTWWRGLLQDGGTRVPMTMGTWCYLIATFDGTVIRLYKNGVEVSVSNTISVSPRINTYPLFLGKSTSYVNGIMDEIRIEGTARSADWIKLCYMNQRVDDKLVIFK